jgi:TrmH family RNA methyltransferase
MGEKNANIRIVLVEPQESKNIGSVCRAMKTMGLGALYIVGGKPVNRAEALVTAVHAVDVLDRAVFCGRLEEALEDTVLAAGITRRRGKWRKYFALTPEQLCERIASLGDACCALVFGNEASGLSDGQLSLCHLAVHIPSSSRFPSLNLSHAVQVIAYQIFRQTAAGKNGLRSFHPISDRKLGSLVKLMIASLENIGFFTQGDRSEMAVFLRDILARSALERREADRLAVIFRKISGLVAGKAVDGDAVDGKAIDP